MSTNEQPTREQVRELMEQAGLAYEVSSAAQMADTIRTTAPNYRAVVASVLTGNTVQTFVGYYPRAEAADVAGRVKRMRKVYVMYAFVAPGPEVSF
jgi:hypothetical protein